MGSELTAEHAGDHLEASATSTSGLKPEDLLYWTSPADNAVALASSSDVQLTDYTLDPAMFSVTGGIICTSRVTARRVEGLQRRWPHAEFVTAAAACSCLHGRFVRSQSSDSLGQPNSGVSIACWLRHSCSRPLTMLRFPKLSCCARSSTEVGAQSEGALLCSCALTMEPLLPQEGYSTDDSSASARLPPILPFATYGACRVLSTTPDSQASAPPNDAMSCSSSFSELAFLLDTA